MSTLSLSNQSVTIAIDTAANTYTLYMTMEPHLAARIPVGAKACSQRNNGRIKERWRVAHVDQALGRVYLVPAAAWENLQ